MARPRKPVEDLHEHVMRVRFTDNQWLEVQRIARERDTPPAIIAREAAILGLTILKQRQAA